MTDLSQNKKKQKMLLIKKKDNIIQQFNSRVMKLLNIAINMYPKYNKLDRVKKAVSICRDMHPTFMIKKSSPSMLEYKEHIVLRDAEFFKTCPTETGISETDDDELVQELIGLIRDKFFNLSDAEKTTIWDYINDMLNYTIEYKLIMEQM